MKKSFFLCMGITSISLCGMEQPPDAIELCSIGEFEAYNSYESDIESMASDDSQEFSVDIPSLKSIDNEIMVLGMHYLPADQMTQIINNPFIDARDSSGRNRLHYGLLLCNKKIVGYILELMNKAHKEDFTFDHPMIDQQDAEGKTPLHYALIKPDRTLPQLNIMLLQCAPLLIEHDADLNVYTFDQEESPLHLAIKYQAYSKKLQELRHQIIRLLLIKGAQVNMQNIRGQTPLHYALLTENDSVLTNQRLEDIPYLFDFGATCTIQDADGNTPLHYVVLYQVYDAPTLQKRRDMLGNLVKRGVDINTQNRLGQTALHCALQEQGDNSLIADRRLALIPTLLDLNISVTSQDIYGNTACQHTRQRSMEKTKCALGYVLLKKGANPNIQNKWGCTPLNILVACVPFLPGKTPCNDLPHVFSTLRLLLAHGADANIPDKQGYNALHKAVCRTDPELVDLLLSSSNTNPNSLRMPHKNAVAPQPLYARSALAMAKDIQESTEPCDRIHIDTIVATLQERVPNLQNDNNASNCKE